MKLSVKQNHRHREQTCGCLGWWQGREVLGVWDYQMQTFIYRMDKGLTV